MAGEAGTHQGSSGDRRGRPDRGDGLVAAQVLCLAGLLWPGPPRWSLPAPVLVAAWVAVLTGAVSVAAGFLRLGRDLRAHPAPKPDATLRTDGAFGVVRHPIYAALLLLATGVAVRSRQVEPLVALAALAGVLHVKTGYEERLLRNRFGPAYDAYAARVPRFVPRLWPQRSRR